MTRRIETVIVCLLVAITALADSINSAPVTISLITCYPGREVYELYGHTQIRVTQGNSDYAFNYGLFDFDAPNFVYRFVKGQTDYMVAGFPASMMLNGYERRKVVEQVLNLSQQQAIMVRDMLYENAQPQNAMYRYNYIYDNCSIRPRNIIERATGGTLRYPAMPDTLTFRHEMARYNINYPWMQFGIDLALGSGLDFTLDYRQQMFVPMVLMRAFGGATIERDGKRVPLVARTTVINPGKEEGDVLAPTPWFMTPLAVTWLFLIIVAGMSVRDIKRGEVCRWFDCTMFTIYALGGCLIFFLIFVSTHAATSPNLNGVWLNPFYFIPAVAIWIKSVKKPLYYYHFANFAVLIVLLLAWFLQPQEANAAFFPLIIASATRSLNYLVINRKCIRKAIPTGC
ncbi:MAG: DUF4105 domain-containing protein [Muribaculaceae bacterium]|jgi:hypothetical protein|nr:DUF4105 domain-containing protein [Muribaculaceae bacterium]